MTEERTFNIGNLSVKVGLCYVSDQPCWLGGPYKWSITPIYPKRKQMPVGYNIPQAGNTDNIGGVIVSIGSSTMQWYAKLKNKKILEIKQSEEILSFIDSFREWVDSVYDNTGGIV